MCAWRQDRRCRQGPVRRSVKLRRANVKEEMLLLHIRSTNSADRAHLSALSSHRLCDTYVKLLTYVTLIGVPRRPVLLAFASAIHYV